MKQPMAIFPLLLALPLLHCDSAQGPVPTRFGVRDPYDRQGNWYRSNFHVHTSHSDGALNGEELVRLYEDAGYGALCITDHNQYGDQDGGVLTEFQEDSTLHDWNGDGILHASHVLGSGVEAYVRDWRNPQPSWARDRWVQPALAPGGHQIVLLSGAETSQGGNHIGLIGCPPGWVESPQQGTEFLQRTSKAGGFVYLAHPGPLNENPEAAQEALSLGDFHGIEIMNGLWLTKNGPADATPLWDKLLARGVRLWGLANDDAHHEIGSSEAYPFTAFNMVLTEDLSPRGVLEALHAGAFYASTGLFFEQLELQDKRLVVHVPGAERLRFIGRRGSALLEVAASSATYDIGGLEGYVRVEAEAAPVAEGTLRRCAWSQPYFIVGAAGAGAP